MMRTSRAILIMLVVLAAPVLLHAQTTWYVDDDCSPPTTGTDLDPFCTIQDGVDATSDGDTVLVAPGTYTGDGNRDISLFGKTITVLATDGPDWTTIDIEGNPQSIHRGFFLNHGETRETLIEGFTITGGNLIGDTGGSGPAGGGGGAGIYLGASSPTIRNCVVVGNISRTVWNPFVHDGRGGGILLDRESSALIENCMILGNEADRQGGGMLHIGGEGTTAAVRNSLFAFNLAEQGGGIHNAAPANFGNIINYDNNVIVNNFASLIGGGFNNGHSHGIIRNTIIWGNDSNVGAQVSVSGSLFTIEYSVLQGGEQGIEGTGGFEWGAGMLDADPLFFDPENGDYHLLHGSPCIDAGNNLALPEGVTTDLDGGPRFLDDPDTPDTGNPDPDDPKLPIVDMGPYEFDPDDCNNNDAPDLDDIADGISQDCNANDIPDECEFDCNGNSQPDDCDIEQQSSEDCNDNGAPDECEINSDSPAPGGPFYCDPSVEDCDPDCNDNGQPDSCDIADESSEDCDDSGVPDECEADCNGNGVQDVCDIAGGTSQDCGGEGIPDDCPENPGPVILAQPMSQDAEVGDFVVFGVQADGVLPAYQWRKDGEDLTDTERIFGTQSAGLFILDVELTDAGAYDCEVTDFGGACALSNPATLTVTDSCPADFDDDGAVSAFDLAVLLGSWGPCDEPCAPSDPADTCAADLDGDCTIEAFDLALLLGHWGPCL